MVDDHQLQARVYQGIDQSALTVGDHGDFSIRIQPEELKQKRRLQHVIAKGAKAQ